MIHRPIFVPAMLLALAVIGCDGDKPPGTTRDTFGADLPTEDTGPDTEDTGADTDASDVADVASARVVFDAPFSAGGQPLVGATSVAPTADGGTVYIGSSQGLYRGTAPGFEAILVAEFRAKATDPYVLSVVVRQNGELLVLTGDLKIWSSTDAGASWAVADDGPLPGRPVRPNLVTNGEAVILVPGEGPAFLQTQTGEPWAPITTDRTDSIELHPLDVDTIAFGDDGKLYANSRSFFGAGVYQIDLDQATAGEMLWTRVVGLDETRGYEAFAFAGDKAVTANATTFFVREGGQWRASHTPTPTEVGAPDPRPAMAFATVGETFIASGGDGLRRSSDGVNWESLPMPPWLDGNLAAAAGRLFGGMGSLCTSDDLGTTWTYHPGRHLEAETVVVSGDTIISNYGLGLAFSQKDQDDMLVLPIPERTAQLVLADGELWASTYNGELFTGLGLNAEATLVDADWGPNEDPDALRKYFGTPLGLFASTRPNGLDTRPYCGLLRFDAARNWWARANHGLPDVDGCESAVRHITSIEGVIFAGTESGETYRSVDRGAEWTRVRDGVIMAAATCGGRLVALTEGGAFWQSDDMGQTFSEIVDVELPSATSLVSVRDTCVVGLNRLLSGPTLHVSTDGESFEPMTMEFVEPVLALAADADTLAVSTMSLGVLRVAVSEK